MKTSKVNWKAKNDLEVVVTTDDFQVRFADALSFDSPNMPFRNKPGYQLVYRPTGHVQAEGVDVVAAVAQIYREQRVLDRVKAKPELLEKDPHEGRMSEFLEDMDTEGRAAN
jgi:hypothetical protein